MATFGVEGTGSYGAGLARFLSGRDHRVVEVIRPDRSTRRRLGKSDLIDAEAAARSVLAGTSKGSPKSGTRSVEMIRMLKVAKDSALKARTQAINQMKALVMTAPEDIREALGGLSVNHLTRRCVGFRPGDIGAPTAAAPFHTIWRARFWVRLAPVFTCIAVPNWDGAICSRALCDQCATDRILFKPCARSCGKR